MDMTNKEYGAYVNSKSKPSPIWKNMLWAFGVGGLLCAFGEFLLHTYQNWGLDKDSAALLASITLIFLSALFTGLKLYDKLAKRAGAGTLVPITGFANSIVAPAMEFKSEGLITGMAAKMFTIAGPVLVFGISASVI